MSNMYTFKVDDDNEIINTVYQTIMQRSNLVDNIQLLIPRTYKGIDMTDAAVTMKYILPVSREYKTMQLTLNNSSYKENYLQYIIPGTTELTAQAGDIQFYLTFIKLEQLEEGSFNAFTRQTNEGKLHITAIPDWANIVPDDALSAIDQRLIALEVLIQQMDAMNQERYNTTVNEIKIDESQQKLYLDSINGQIGEGLEIEHLSRTIGKNIVGEDLDGIEDGITHLDKINVINLDQLTT